MGQAGALDQKFEALSIIERGNGIDNFDYSPLVREGLVEISDGWPMLTKAGSAWLDSQAKSIREKYAEWMRTSRPDP